MPLQAVRHFETLRRLVDSSRQEPQVPGHGPRRSDRGRQDGGDPVSGAGRPLLHGDSRHHGGGLLSGDVFRRETEAERKASLEIYLTT